MHSNTVVRPNHAVVSGRALVALVAAAVIALVATVVIPPAIGRAFTGDQVAYIKADNTGEDDWFGKSVAIDGDTMVVGAPQEDSSAAEIDGDNGDDPNFGQDNFGAAYVFVRDGSGEWTQQAYLKPSLPLRGAHFGASVAINGDTIVVGAPESNLVEGEGSHGRAFVFERDGTDWEEADVLVAHDLGENAEFGRSVAVSGDTIVVGSPFEDGDTTAVDNEAPFPVLPDPVVPLHNSGALYTFVRDDGGAWPQTAYLKASGGPDPAADRLGTSVAIDGDRIAAGAELEGEGQPGSGAVYVFDRDVSGDWAQAGKLKADPPGQTDSMGYSVALDGDRIVAGARFQGSDNGGAAYIFEEGVSGWFLDAVLERDPRAANELYGFSVAVDGDLIVVGANQASDSETVDAGLADVWEKGAVTWALEDTLTASNLEVGSLDEFGHSVALSGDTIVAGAPFEDSNAVGVNGDQDNNLAGASGAVYVFVDAPEPPDPEPELALESDLNPSIVGDLVTFTATVTLSGSPVTTGTVDFLVDDVLTAADVALDPQGEATFITNALSAGSHEVTAEFSPTATDSLTQVVNPVGGGDDTTPPTIDSLTISLVEGGQVGSVPVRVSWTASDDSSASGDMQYELQQRNRRPGGNWTAWKDRGIHDGLTSVDRLIFVTRRNVQFRVRAMDEADNVGEWRNSGSFWLRLRQSNKAPDLTGDWNLVKVKQASKRKVLRSSDTAAQAAYDFTGKGLGVVMRAAPGQGSFEACIDPETINVCQQVDLSSFSPAGHRRLVAVFNDIGGGSHTLVVSVVSGSVDFDAVIIRR